MRIHVHARLEDLRPPSDCRREARRLVPEALRALGEAICYARSLPELTEVERLLLIGVAGRRFAHQANARLKRQLEQKLFDQLWWAVPFPRLSRDTIGA